VQSFHSIISSIDHLITFLGVATNAPRGRKTIKYDDDGSTTTISLHEFKRLMACQERR
jgi:hypothetical protein